jgi:hypothetical protein
LESTIARRPELADAWRRRRHEAGADLVAGALQQVGDLGAMMIGDTTCDVDAAKPFEVQIGILAGGLLDEERRAAPPTPSGRWSSP